MDHAPLHAICLDNLRSGRLEGGELRLDMRAEAGDDANQACNDQRSQNAPLNSFHAALIADELGNQITHDLHRKLLSQVPLTTDGDAPASGAAAAL
jgi:hypothetical protein